MISKEPVYGLIAFLVGMLIIVSAVAANSAVAQPTPEIVRRAEYVPDPKCQTFVAKADKLLSLTVLMDHLQLDALKDTIDAQYDDAVTKSKEMDVLAEQISEVAGSYESVREKCLAS